MDLGFAISELRLKFEREYKSGRERMLGDVNSRGMISSGERWKRENEVFHAVMEQHLEQLFNSVEGHIAYLTNRSARKSVKESKTKIVDYVNERFDEFRSTTLKDRGRHDGFQINDELYVQIKKRIEDDVKYPLNELLKNRFNKIEQIIEGRPDPLWNRPWASNALSAIIGAIVGSAPVWLPKLASFIKMFVSQKISV